MLCMVSCKRIIAIVAGAVLLGCGIAAWVHRPDAAAAGGKSGLDSYCEQALVRTYLPSMQGASDAFYKEYFKESPRIEDFNTSVKEITKQGGPIEITFVASPFLGAHNSVGVDEITFTVGEWGDVNLEKFSHVISYSLPEHLLGLSIKAIPGRYE